MPKRFPLTEDELLERLAWALHRNSGQFRFARRSRMIEMGDCLIVARHQVDHLRRSGVLVDEIERQQAEPRSLHHPHGPES